ncbi:MAG TPA: DUF6438 domain-containing protein [Gemmatimonadales bacterium]|nr:DUF6438 domain-containing protein [Gemmatimonadales bacterium]
MSARAEACGSTGLAAAAGAWRRRIGTAGTVAAAALVACSPRPGGSAESPAPAAGAASDVPAVTLERRPCFGTCPVYTVAISQEGTIRFTGKHHVSHKGEATAAIPAARVDSLVAELEAGGYFELADDYVMGAPACGRYATDSPTVITSVTRDGRTKTIRHDYGCFEAPRALAQLERRIDEVAGTSRWTGR